MADMAVRRLDLGYFIRPASETGSSQPRAEPVLAYLVRHGNGLILFDTGIGDADPETEAHYRPRRRALQEALSAAGVGLDDISVVVNCHLHFDHCGGNPLLGGRPVFVQEAELAAARGGDHTFDELVDFPGATYEVIVGETEIWPRAGSSRRPVTRRAISRWSSVRTTARWSSQARCTTSPPTSRPSTWPAARHSTVWNSPCRRTGAGWTDSRTSTPVACSSPTTARSGNHHGP
ncbi:hypothetical protein SALBM217S_06662 [Streptomyces griseoloalbus]